ncbi:hypothetical protein V5O48_006171 [Marasmius crinis-equi]|uniref:Uncharacterized protein n=1 Tax=Marasmius crinis-equi TaxID=585013 RepID=A0ABR3FK80_9AGAR
MHCGRKIFEISAELGRLDGTLLLDNVLKRSQTPRKRATGGNQSLECPDAHTYWWYVLGISVRRLADGVADLVPLAHLADQVGEIGQMYLRTLALQMGCYVDSSMWMDTSRGVFCRGPPGPRCWTGMDFGLEDLPLDAELVKEDVLARYLGSRNLNRRLVDALSPYWDGDPSELKVNRPTVIATLTDTIIAVGPSGIWEVEQESCLGGREELANGATRFTLEHNGCCLELTFDWREAWSDWLAQALSVFHAHGIPLEGDMETYELVSPLMLFGMLSSSGTEQQRRKESPPIYLFIPPFSTSIFWSFDPDGQNPITADRCHYLGLPTSLSLECKERYWPIQTYQGLQAYQIAGGFNPNTTEFARRNRYPIYEIVEQPFPSRFEEHKDLEDSEDSEGGEGSVETTETPLQSVNLEQPADMLLSGKVQPEDPAMNTTTQGHALQNGIVHSLNYLHSKPTATFSDFTDSTSAPDTAHIERTLPEDLKNVFPSETEDPIPMREANVWSRFIPTFSWAALEDSEIHAAGF